MRVCMAGHWWGIRASGKPEVAWRCVTRMWRCKEGWVNGIASQTASMWSPTCGLAHVQQGNLGIRGSDAIKMKSWHKGRGSVILPPRQRLHPGLITQLSCTKQKLTWCHGIPHEDQHNLHHRNGQNRSLVCRRHWGYMTQVDDPQYVNQRNNIKIFWLQFLEQNCASPGSSSRWVCQRSAARALQACRWARGLEETSDREKEEWTLHKNFEIVSLHTQHFSRSQKSWYYPSSLLYKSMKLVARRFLVIWSSRVLHCCHFLLQCKP